MSKSKTINRAMQAPQRRGQSLPKKALDSEDRFIDEEHIFVTTHKRDLRRFK